MIKNRKNRKGFTLIELLVVIAIIAVLAVVVVLTLNPAELLRQARDSNRLSDFATLKSALALYSSDVNTTTPMYGTGADSLYSADVSGSTTTSSYQGSAAANWGFSTSTNAYAAIVISTSRLVTGAGWIPVNFSVISSGAPIGALPVDPTNAGALQYVYGATSTQYKLAAKMESAKYSSGGSADVVSVDGGNSTTTYEQGTNLAL